MVVKNPNKLPTIDYRKVKPLQGDLKDLSKSNYQKLKNVLEKRGFTTPLFLWKSGDDYYLMDGHQRQRVMQKEDMQPYEVPYVLIEAKDITEAKEQLLEITSQYGTITQEGFDEFTADLPQADLVDVNFDALPLLGEEEVEVEEDELPEVSSEPPKSKLGEIYQLGRHRVMCGDATKAEYVERLLEKEPDLIFTDPPYGIDYQDTKGKHEKIKNDSTPPGTLIREALTPAKAVYVCCNWRSLSWIITAMNEAGHEPKACIVWDKGSRIQNLDKFAKQHEFIVYSGPYGGEKTVDVDVWGISREVREDHPTAKPVSLYARAINHSSSKDEMVYDPFGGSGGSVVACEQLERDARVMELEPKYVDVIRKRYAKAIDKEDDWINATPVIETAR